MKLLKLPPEEWKLIPDLPFPIDRDYEISNHGRVRHVLTGKILKGGNSSGEGWWRYRLSLRVKKYNFKLVDTAVYPHRLVWQLWGDEPATTKRHIYHINKCRRDNYIWNLALTGKRFHKRRIARWRKEGVWIYRRPKRYFHDRTKK